MARKKSMTSLLFKAARLAASGRAVRRSVETGSAKSIERRAGNIVKGRALARLGFWRRLWK